MIDAVLIQVSMKSRRLPGKALADLAGEPVIWRVHERVSQAGLPVIWCIRDDPEDAPLYDLARDRGVNFYRGHWDAMHRMVECANHFNIDNIVRVTGDNPLTCPVGIASAVAVMRDRLDAVRNSPIVRKSKAGFQANPMPLPRGMRCEVVTVERLTACREAYPIEDSEPVFGHLIRGEFPQEIRQERADYGINWPEDLEFVRSIYEHYQGNPPTSAEIIAQFRRERI